MKRHTMRKRIRPVASALALAWLTAALATPTSAQMHDAAPDPAQAIPAALSQAQVASWAQVQTQTLAAGGVDFAYRELGKQHGGTPLVLLNHLAAVLDSWDPRVVDGIAARRHVIVFNNRGVGASTGTPSNSMEQMADDAINFIKATGFRKVDLLGFSMGGMVAQEILLKQPLLVRRLILAGTGPAGGAGISDVAGVANYDLLRGLFTGQDPKQYLFFTRTPNGIQAGKEFLARLKERSQNRDDEISIRAYVAQLQALSAWGRKAPVDLSVIEHPVLVVNGDDDRMVPTPNSHDLARRLPNSTLVIYADAGHGGVFQHHADFVPLALEFLARQGGDQAASARFAGGEQGRTQRAAR
jgi:pimeloyl-ACP methyl ester carboxylesterase